MARASEALHETRERPLRAVHALNRALLLSDAGEPEAALGVLQVARDEVGDWPLLAPLEDQLLAREALLRAAVGERELGRALLERASASRRRRSPSPTPWLSAAPAGRDPRAARDVPRSAPPQRGRHASPAMGTPLSVHAEAWLLDALALDALAEPEDAAASLDAHSISPTGRPSRSSSSTET